MRNQLVYDAPIRLFHWIIVGLFVSAFLIVKTVDDDSVTFSYHMLAGLLLTFTVSLRVIWGFVGSENSRFSSFALNPSDLFSYFSGILAGNQRKWAGHNPASSWAALVMFALIFGLAASGIAMANGYEETFEDLHELFANAFVVVSLLHVAGVTLHGIRHRDLIGLSMIDGKKQDVPNERTLRGTHSVAAVVFVLMIASFAGYLGRNFNSQNRTLNLFGTSLQLGESEEGEGHLEGGETNENDDNSDDE